MFGFKQVPYLTRELFQSLSIYEFFWLFALHMVPVSLGYNCRSSLSKKRENNRRHTNIYDYLDSNCIMPQYARDIPRLSLMQSQGFLWIDLK